MFHLVIFLCISLAKGISDQRNVCGGTFSKIPYDEFLEGISHEEYTLHPYTGTFKFEASFCIKNRFGLIATAVDSRGQFFVLIEINNGTVQVENYMKSQTTPHCLWSLGPAVNDGKKYKFVLILDSENKHFDIGLHGETFTSNIEINITECAPGIIPQFKYLEVGSEIHYGNEGVRPTLLKSFAGCLRTWVNGKRLPLVSHKNTSLSIQECDTFETECIDDCSGSFQSNRTHCTCSVISKSVPFEEKCEQSCDCVKCQNGGSCTSDNDGNLGCRCQELYVGDLCEIHVDPCDQVKCHNGGNCTLDQNNTPSCICTELFTGDLCENEIDPCDKLLCRNGGFCDLNEIGNSQCYCMKFYAGNLCEIMIDTCVNASCDNNGTCKKNFALHNGYECQCSEDFEGTHCEKPRHSSANIIHTKTFLYATGFSLLVVAVLAIVILLFLIRRRRKSIQQKYLETEVITEMGDLEMNDYPGICRRASENEPGSQGETQFPRNVNSQTNIVERNPEDPKVKKF